MFRCPDHLKQYRVSLFGEYGDDQNGFMLIKSRGLKVLFSSGEGWEHVSVSRRSRVPDYWDMCFIKENFWSDDECVMQLHVPKEDHVNCHPYCLHLWRPINQEIPRPPTLLVGPT